jgi:ATP-dependent RNA helicase DeaD
VQHAARIENPRFETGETVADSQGKAEDKSPLPVHGFGAFALRPEILSTLAAIGYTEPTQVQLQAIPLAMAGKDLIVQSRTGTGKTAAFGIRIAEAVDGESRAVQALVLTPARELTVQVSAEVSRIGAGRALKCVAVYGGRPIDRQIEELRQGAQTVVGTPGRILDHLRRGTLRLDALRVLVLDEADLMLDMGFEKEMRQILDHLPPKRQTLLFSATIPRAIEAMAQKYLSNPEKLLLSEDYVYVKEVSHEYYITNRMQKERNLCNLLEFEDPPASMIFCNTREETRVVANYLGRKGLPVAMLSSDLSQARREKVMARFRKRELRHLVATDVAARGIDIEGLTHVFIFSAPSSPDQYVHRAGRTGRIGRSGKAISLVAAQDLVNFNKLVRVNNLELIEKNFPSHQEVAARKSEHLLKRLRDSAQTTAPEDLLELEPVARHIANEPDRDTLVAMLLQEHFCLPPVDLDSQSEEGPSTSPPENHGPGTGSAGAGSRRRRRRRRPGGGSQ